MKDIYDPGFGIHRSWDIPLLDGYECEFLENIARDPGSHHFQGIHNPDIVRKVLSFSPDALLLYGWAFRSHLTLMRKLKGVIPVFFRGDSTWLDMEEKTWIHKTLKRIFLSWVYRYIDKAFFVGSANHTYFRLCGLRNNQLFFAPHAIDNNRFHSKHETYELKADEWKRRLGIPDDHFVFLFAGKLEKKKAPDLLIHSFIALQHPNTTLVICGNGIMEKELKRLASGRSDIIFIPFQNQQDMPVVYRLGDVFVLPSRGPSETWGLAINEAMASSRPVIVSDKCGAARDLVKDDVTGYVFTSDSSKDLITKMKRILDTRGEIQILSVNALDKIQNYSYENICTAIETAVA